VAFAQDSRPYRAKPYLAKAVNAVKEWRFLEAVSECAINGVGLRIPVPVAYPDDLATLLTEHVHDEMLSRRKLSGLADLPPVDD
jgi:hypothetical protein